MSEEQTPFEKIYEPEVLQNIREMQADLNQIKPYLNYIEGRIQTIERILASYFTDTLPDESDELDETVGEEDVDVE